MKQKTKLLLGKLDHALSSAQNACSDLVTVEARESIDAGDRASHRLGTDIWSDLERLRRRIRHEAK